MVQARLFLPQQKLCVQDRVQLPGEDEGWRRVRGYPGGQESFIIIHLRAVGFMQTQVFITVFLKSEIICHRGNRTPVCLTLIEKKATE